MKEYEEVVRKRMIQELALAIVLVPLGIVTLIFFLNADPILGRENIRGFIGGMFNGMRGGMTLGFAIFLFSLFVKDYKANKDDAKRKKMYVEENDERQNSISLMACKRTVFITMYSLIVATVVVGFFNAVASITLLFVCAFMFVVWVRLQVFYEKRM